MSEEVLQAAADLDYVSQLRSIAERLSTQLTRMDAELILAKGRERVAVEAYERQQSSQRELEALYQAACERLIEAETELAELRRVAGASRQLVATIRGDGNGRCWCGAKAADALRKELHE